MREIKGIGIHGLARSGKTTVANSIQNELTKINKLSKIFNFSDGLKKVALELFPELQHTKNRKILQGFNCLRNIDENVFVNYTDRDIASWNNTCKKEVFPIIADIRQLNELEYCKNNEFLTIKIICDKAERIRRMETLGDEFKTSDLEHSTERELNDNLFDLIIDTTEKDIDIKNILKFLDN